MAGPTALQQELLLSSGRQPCSLPEQHCRDAWYPSRGPCWSWPCLTDPACLAGYSSGKHPTLGWPWFLPGELLCASGLGPVGLWFSWVRMLPLPALLPPLVPGLSSLVQQPTLAAPWHPQHWVSRPSPVGGLGWMSWRPLKFPDVGMSLHVLRMGPY